MWAPRRSDLALVATATIAAGVLVLLDDDGWPEWLFGSVMFSLLGLLGRLGVEAWRSARNERERASHLAELRPAEVARRAVAEERVRLEREVEQSIRDSLREVAAEMDRMDRTAPVPALKRVHALTRRTTSELRRQLGLLRDPAAGEEPVATATSPASRVPTRRALVGGLVVGVLAAVESVAYLLTAGPSDWLPWSAVVSALAGTTVALRTAPAPALVGFAGLVGLGSLVGYPVTSGFWIVIAPGVLLWSLMAVTVPRGREVMVAVCVIATLVGVVVWAFRRDDPSNLGVLLVVMFFAAAGGLVVAAQRRGHARAHEAARSREQELDAVAVGAVREERVVIARELHDVVSHAVGVIAMQAAAAELSWPRDPVAVTRAVDVIRRTTAETLVDLDRLPPWRPGSGHTLDDLLAVVDRVRLAGTPVELTVVGDVSGHAEVVHRVVQESLTNAMRHAPGASVAVQVRADPTTTHVSVSDDGPGPGRSPRRGYGLAGLAERVELAGGSFESGPGPEGRGFLVSASIPQRAEMRTP